MKKWKVLKSKYPINNQWHKVRQDVVELPDGRVFDDYYLWDSNDVVMVIPRTTDDKYLLVKQYKHGAGELMIEYPAGFVDKDEDPNGGGQART